MYGIKGVIFDLDGVLVDTEGFQWRGWIEVLKPFGLGMSKEDYIKNYAGNTGTFIASELIQRHNLDIDPEKFLEDKEEIMLGWFKKEPIELMPHSKEIIEYFESKPLKLAVASGGPRGEVDIKLKKNDLDHKFIVTLSRNDVVNGKPHPDVYQLGAEKLGLKTGECIAFEDTSFGVRSAKAAGLICVAVPNEYSLKQDFSMADAVVGNLKEAQEWFNRG